MTALSATDIAELFFEDLGIKYARVQGADPTAIASGTRVWCACYIDLDYRQAYLLRVYEAGHITGHIAVLQGPGDDLLVEWLNERYRSLYDVIPFFGEWVSELIGEEREPVQFDRLATAERNRTEGP